MKRIASRVISDQWTDSSSRYRKVQYRSFPRASAPFAPRESRVN